MIDDRRPPEPAGRGRLVAGVFCLVLSVPALLVAGQNFRWAATLLLPAVDPLPPRVQQMRERRGALSCGSCCGGVLSAVVGTLLLVSNEKKAGRGKPMAMSQTRRLRRLARGRCPECGYDLTGNVSGACPECGTPAAGPSVRRLSDL